MHDENQNNIYCEDDSISLKELFSIIWKGKILIILVSIIFLLIAFIGGKIYNNKNAQLISVVSLQWDGIDNGELPNNQEFNPNNMFSISVLNEALNQAELNKINISDLRKNLNVTGIVPNDTVALIEQALKNGEKFTYHPTDFRITLNHGALGISKKQGIILFEALREQFRIDFEEKYIKNNTISEIIVDKLGTFDYADIYDIINAQILLIHNEINYLYGDDSSVSNNIKSSLSALKINADRISKTIVQDVLASLNTPNYLLSKDPELTKGRYVTQIRDYEYKLTEKTAIKTDLQTLIDTYKGEQIIIIPGTDVQFETKPYLNSLYEKLVNTNAEIARINTSITELQDRIAKLPTPTEQQSSSYKAQIEQLESKITLAIEEVNLLTNNTIEVIEESNSLTMKNCLRTLTIPNEVMPQNIILISAIGCILGFMGSIAFILIRNNYKTKQQL